ncbi:hypothetical protein [Runella slithyformis]|uniref:Uncharacterized protein n=1 Tax=Runella slithyformis (strain ATCC 29530 / DSM 19594 / LMG 11500 / NCIMB 11436 / LSU 4) TaxID=761193 RepID=A0A7U3ZNB7_RUNSL|nr:hypothetical protein [Runella slithyformis]AEI50391.1 hypothetical protein Runsl_4040 [Runella slithyformis DSM 19594]
MKTIKIFFILTLLCQNLYLKAQITIRDTESNENISFVELRDLAGRILGMSDENGIVSKDVIEKIEKGNSNDILIYHMSYKPLQIGKNRLLEMNSINLTRNIIMLDEVVVSSNSKTTSFLVLKGYFRSYNIIDNQLKSYADGMVEYLYPNSSKNDILIKRIQERSFLLPGGKGVPALMNINIVGPRIPDMNLTNESAAKTYSFFDNENQDYFLFAKNKTVRVNKIPLENGKNAILQEISYLTAEDKKVVRRFGNESIHEYHNESSVYNASDSTEISLENLIYHKEIRKFKMKGKNDERFQDVEDVGEFFVEKVDYLQEKPKGFSRFTGFNGFSNYSSKFWEQNSAKKLYNPLPDAILKSLNNDIIELKNINR